MFTDENIGLIGSGSWATAIAKILHNNVNKLNWYVREGKSIDHLKKHFRNPLYLSSVKFDVSKLNIYNDINDVIYRSDIIIFCVPSKFFKDNLKAIKTDLSDRMIVSAIKGIVPDENLLISEYLQKYCNVPEENLAVISGPCHAEEVALERLSYLTVASKNRDLADVIADSLRNHYIKLCLSKDIYGVEFSSVLKNVMALACGICHGLGYGDNFTSVLISNAIQEIKRFIDTVHPHGERDVDASVYLGDLLVTAYSQFSRNRTFGNMIGKGYSVKSAELEMNMIAEGYYGVNCIKQLNDLYNVNMPITEAVYNILYERYSPALEIKLLSENLR